MSDEFLVMPEYHPTQWPKKKKEWYFSLHLFRHLAEQLTDLGIKSRAEKEKFSVHRRQQLSQVTQKQEGMQADPTCKARCWKEPCWAASDGAASPIPESTDPLCTRVRRKLRHEQDSKSMQHLQSLAQLTAFRISKCSFIPGLKFCFLIWFANDARQDLSSCVYQVASAARNPDLFGTLGRTKSLKKEEESTKITVFQRDSQAWPN